MENIKETLSNNSVIAIIGNRGTGKTMLGLTCCVYLRQYAPVYVLGVNTCLKPILERAKITILNSKLDILDLRLHDCFIYVDEFANLFNSENKNKQLQKLCRFFDRIEHQNIKLIISTAREQYFNKFMCSRINAFFCKEIEYDALVNGTWIKDKVLSTVSISDYRLECEKNKYYVMQNDQLTKKYSYEYMQVFDTKKQNKDLFEV